MFSFPSYLQHDSPQEHLRGMGVEALVRMTISMSICMSIRMSTHRSMRIHVHMFILHDNAQSIHMSIHMPIHSSRPTCIHLAAVARHFSHYSRALLWSWHFPSKKKRNSSLSAWRRSRRSLARTGASSRTTLYAGRPHHSSCPAAALSWPTAALFWPTAAALLWPSAAAP